MAVQPVVPFLRSVIALQPVAQIDMNLPGDVFLLQIEGPPVIEGNEDGINHLKIGMVYIVKLLVQLDQIIVPVLLGCLSFPRQDIAQGIIPLKPD
ncbi:hypothetical protein D3C73_1059270 [compost metagenome]